MNHDGQQDARTSHDELYGRPRRWVWFDYHMIAAGLAQASVAVFVLQGVAQYTLVAIAVVGMILYEISSGKVRFRVRVLRDGDGSLHVRVRCRGLIVFRRSEVKAREIVSVVIGGTSPDSFYPNVMPCDYGKAGACLPSASDVYLLTEMGEKTCVALSVPLIAAAKLATDLQRALAECGGEVLPIEAAERFSQGMACPLPRHIQTEFATEVHTLRPQRVRWTAHLKAPAFFLLCASLLAASTVGLILSGAPVWFWALLYFLAFTVSAIALSGFLELIAHASSIREQSIVEADDELLVIARDRTKARIPFRSILDIAIETCGPEYTPGADRFLEYDDEGVGMTWDHKISRLPELVIAQETGQIHRIGRGCDLDDLMALRGRLLGTKF